MTHTFLLREGVWLAAGTCKGADGRSLPVDGRTEVTHGVTAWVVDGAMRLLDQTPVEFRNRYDVVPFAPDADATTWTSSNPAIGTLHGRFAVVADTIISTYESDDREWSGAECLILMRDTRYLARGVLFRHGAAVSSWTVELRRIKP